MSVMESGQDIMRIDDGQSGDTQELLSLCSLMAGGKLFGIDTRMIREVLGKARLNRVPLAPAYVGGVLAYRGDVVTVVSLRALLGEREREGNSCVLVLDGDVNEERFGLLVDSVGGVVMVERGLMAANPSTLDEISRAMFSGAFRTDEGLLVQLDPERLRPSQLAESGLFGNLARVRDGSQPGGDKR
jgi:purine-binding chemotaxis protein CheW